MNTNINHIIVGEHKIEVIKKDIMNIHLAVYPPNGRIRVASPFRINDEAIRLFVITKLPWIKKQIRKFQNQDRQSKRQYLNRESHYFQGTRYLLNIIEHNAPPKVELHGKTHLDMYIRSSSSNEKRAKILNEWYREQLKKQIPGLIEKWQKKIGVEVNEWGVKQMVTKWGTCNIKAKRIWINLELAKKPIHCLEYIIVHEMIHLLERNHNEKFISLMNKFLPHWDSYKHELNRFPLNHSEWEY